MLLDGTTELEDNLPDESILDELCSEELYFANASKPLSSSEIPEELHETNIKIITTRKGT